MSVNSWLFLLAFLPGSVVSVLLARRLMGVDAAWWVLLAWSALFVLAGGIADAGVLAASIAMNHALSSQIGNARLDRSRRKRWLRLAIGLNVCGLAFYKYSTVLASVLLVDQAGLAPLVPQQIPLGLSFYTIAQCIYLVDLADDLVVRTTWLNYAGFVSLFSNVTAGPILRFRKFASQRGNLGLAGHFPGGRAGAALLICLGLVKKVAIGDSFARISTAAYSEASTGPLFGDAWFMAVSGALEIYFDFSGYSDMAFGVAGVLGLTLVQNFRTPFAATDISDFWRRWHISLSEFITGYLYTPLLRALGRPSIHTSAFATVVAMLLAGIWHGASWNYVLFGAFHGFALAGFQYWKRLRRPLPQFVAQSVTFAFVVIAFVTVKSASVEQSMGIWTAMVTPSRSGLRFSIPDTVLLLPDSAMILAAASVGLPLAFFGPTADILANRVASTRWLVPVIFLALVLAFTYMIGGATTDFRYRQF